MSRLLATSIVFFALAVPTHAGQARASRRAAGHGVPLIVRGVLTVVAVTAGAGIVVLRRRDRDGGWDVR